MTTLSLKTLLFTTLSATLMNATATAAPATTLDSAKIQASATKAVQLMEKSIASTAPNVPCGSCHHHMLPVWALSQIRTHGVPVDSQALRKLTLQTYKFVTNVDRAIQGSQFVDPALEGAELLGFGKDAGVPGSFTTAMHARRLATLQRPDGHWATFDNRPPQSFSLFMTTALSAKSVKENVPVSLQAETAERLAKARQWLLRNEPVSTEDMTFRLFGLVWTKASKSDIKRAAKMLMAAQNADGGWGQNPSRSSDAYATGEALAALRITGYAKADSQNRGIQFLLNTQLQDGSWLVKTRLHEVTPISPPYMETGFPHGKDQIISMYGTTWAALALALELPRQSNVEPLQYAELMPKTEPWMEAAAFGPIAELANMDLATAKTAAGSTALMAASQDPARVAILLDRGADVNATSRNGHTALTAAATYNGSAKVLAMLIGKGASAKPRKGVEFNSNPMVYVAFANDREAAKVLLDNGASATQGMLLEGLVPANPLTAAVSTNSVDVLRELLARGIDPNTVGDVPILSQAALGNRAEAVKVLLEAGADPELKDKYNWTPIQHARGIEHDRSLVEPLLEAAIRAKAAAASNAQATANANQQ